MADRTGLGVLSPERFWIEPGTVGINPPSPGRGVTGEAVSLGMTRHTALQVLPSGLAVPQGEGAFGVVKPGVQRASTREAGLDVAVGAELTGVVAIATAGLPGIGRSWMAGEESGGVVARRRVGRVGAVAVEALGPDVTAFARLRPGIGNGTMDLGKIRAMRGWASPPYYGTLSPPGARHRQRLNCGRVAPVTRQAALLGVTSGAG